VNRHERIRLWGVRPEPARLVGCRVVKLYKDNFEEKRKRRMLPWLTTSCGDQEDFYDAKFDYTP